MRIMVIDDDSLVLETIGDYLSESGHQVILQRKASEALKALCQNEIDAIFTDVLMPQMDGIEVIRKLREVYPSLWIVAMSGGGQLLTPEFNLHSAMAFGANRLLEKPAGPADVLAVLPSKESKNPFFNFAQSHSVC